MAAERALKAPVGDISNRRADFPALAGHMNGQPLAYLDSAASAQKPQSVIDAINAVYASGYANIHRGLYNFSQVLTEKFEAVRAQVAGFLGAPSAETIVFTRNTTEAINLVAHSWGGTHLQAGDEIILTQMEHHANIVPWQLLAARKDLVIKFVPVLEDGALDYQAFESLLGPRTRLIAITHISNMLGTVNDIARVIKTARAFNRAIKILADGSQGVVHGTVDVAALDVDFYAFTGHKLYGPTGIGVLYGKADALDSMPPWQGGGDMIERVSETGSAYKKPPYRFEAGTPAIAEVIGLGAAIDYVQHVGMTNIAAHEAALHEYAMKSIADIPGLRVYGTAPGKEAIISFTLEGAHTSDIAMVLDQMGVAVRSGHHCCMPLMARFGIDSTLRASLGLYSSRGDIDQLVKGLQKARGMFI